jgi:predicted Zn-dependent peptidase
MTIANFARTHSRRVTLPVLLLVTAAVPAAAQKEAPPTAGPPVSFILPEKRELTLPNGMAVTLVQYGPLPKVDIQLVVRAGNVDESAAQVSLADVMGDLMEQGTTTRGAEQLAREAASMGGSLDVSVGMDQTTIGGSVLSEFAPKMTALVADVARNPALPDSELERIKDNGLRELAVTMTQPQPLALQKFRAVLYPDHPYGRVFPTAEMVKGFTISDVRKFYDANFGAGRAHLYVVGRFDAAAVEAAIRDSFGSWKRGAPERASTPHPTSARAVYLIDRPNAPQSTLLIGLPVAGPTSADYVPLLVTNALLGGSFASRITSNIREQKGYTYSPFSSVSSRYHDSYWAEQADVTTQFTGPSIKEILGEVNRLRATPPSDSELTGIQNYLAGTFVLQNSTRGGIINQLSFINLQGLPDSYLSDWVRRVRGVTPTAVQQMTRKYLDPSRMTIVVVGDEKVVGEQVREFGKVMR